MTPTVVALIVIFGACVAAARRVVPERLYFFQGMFRYDADLGWPHGVQEEDGDRAWVSREHRASDPEEDELAWPESVGLSTIEELDRPLDRGAMVRVKAGSQGAPR